MSNNEKNNNPAELYSTNRALREALGCLLSGEEVTFAYGKCSSGTKRIFQLRPNTFKEGTESWQFSVKIEKGQLFVKFTGTCAEAYTNHYDSASIHPIKAGTDYVPLEFCGNRILIKTEGDETLELDFSSVLEIRVLEAPLPV